MADIIKVEGVLTQAKVEDLYKPWIRIAKSKRGNIKSKEFVKIRGNNKEIFCQIKGTLDENSIAIEMSEHYRELLGWENIPEGEITLELIKPNQFIGIIMTHHYHPDDFVRFGIGLGTTGIFISLLGVLIAVLQTIKPETFLLGIVVALILAFIIGILVGMSIIFLRPFSRN